MTITAKVANSLILLVFPLFRNNLKTNLFAKSISILYRSHSTGGIAYVERRYNYPENRGGGNFEHYKTTACIDR